MLEYQCHSLEQEREHGNLSSNIPEIFRWCWTFTKPRGLFPFWCWGQTTNCIIFWNIFTRYRGEWSHDQMIVTSALEDSGLCSLTPVNGSYSDPGTCWRGSQRFMCCDVNHRVNTNRDVCLWWHFYKPLTMAEVNKSYEYIINRKNIPRLTGDYDYKIWSGYLKKRKKN